MGFIDLLRKLGIFRFGVYKGTYTSAKDMPPEILMDDVYNAKKDLTTKEDIDKVLRRKKSSPKSDSSKGSDPDGAEKRFCQQCGNEISPGANFCAKCGEPVPLS